MNERIEKLISEAIKAIPDHVDFDLPKEFTEKFAELIVRECANINFRHAIGLTSDQSCEVSELIEKHFGIKQ